MPEEDIEYEETERSTHIKNKHIETVKFSLTCNGFRFYICPVGIASEETENLLKMFFMCKEFKCLPEQGAYLDQDNRTLEAFEISNSEINKFNNNEMEKQKKEMKAKSNAK